MTMNNKDSNNKNDHNDQSNNNNRFLVLIDIINKGSMPYSSLTTYHTGVSLSDILFPPFVLAKILSAMYVNLNLAYGLL